MKLHTDTLTISDLYDAVDFVNEHITRDVTHRPIVGVSLHRDSQHNSRSRRRAFDVILSGDASSRINTGWRGGPADEPHAATWDQWGAFLARLFDADETLTIPGIYVDAEHFRWATCEHYSPVIGLAPGAHYHRRHGWTPVGDSAAGSYGVWVCGDGAKVGRDSCGAGMRRLYTRRSWADVREGWKALNS
ncbi:hypothetical protein SEA_DALILPOP_89 [Gordonia phage Dalilpop]|nr:hypothetical protein SEA_DALILPOP_89 [Gordonia phage Dalilpop]